MTKLIVAFRNFANAPKNPAATTTVHLRDYQAECVRALQRKTKDVWNLLTFRRFRATLYPLHITLDTASLGNLGLLV
jgi:hypothetical protein